MVSSRTPIILLATIGTAFAQPPSAVDFLQYPAGPVDTKDHAPLRIRDAWGRQYRDALLAAGEEEVNFAGHYILAEVGCGAGCIMIAAIDAKTGAVIRLPGTVSNWPRPITEPVEYRADSRLLIVHGQLDEAGSSGPHRFVFDGHSFVRQ